MTESKTRRGDRFYRIDRFSVPEAARDQFLGRVRQTHGLLKQQEGFVRDYILESAGSAGQRDIVTIVEWEDEAAVARARASVQVMHRADGFDPKTLFERLGIVADIGHFRTAP